jgi:hypothetical protein
VLADGLHLLSTDALEKVPVPLPVVTTATTSTGSSIRTVEAREQGFGGWRN